MDWIGILSLVIALTTAAGTAWYNHRRSSLEVRKQQFTELTETVAALGESLTCTRAELKETKAELKATKLELRAAEQKIADLETENQDLRRKLRARPVI